MMIIIFLVLALGPTRTGVNNATPAVHTAGTIKVHVSSMEPITVALGINKTNWVSERT